MIKAELIYNPYLSEISVRFNGQPPRINSIIEKYQDASLQDWIDHIPKIFHDEMNGYFFELEYSGTKLDHEEVCNAFRRAGVSEEEVKVFLKNELESREVKIDRIKKLLIWLNDKRYSKFDVDTFRQENSELFDDDYVYIILHSDRPDSKEKIDDIDIESVNDIKELDNTDLTHTPILFCVNNKSISVLPEELRSLRERDDVSDNQIFFLVGTGINSQKTIRFIVDLGINDPNIVSEIYDEKVKKYFLIYPFSDYIANAIKVFNHEIENLDIVLDDANKKGEIKGDEIHARLKIIDDSIHRIKQADEIVVSHENIEFGEEIEGIKSGLMTKIMEWKKKKTKTTDLIEAGTMAAQFDAELRRYYREFCLSIDEAIDHIAAEIRNKYITWYRSAKLDENFTDDISLPKARVCPEIDHQIDNLLDIKKEKLIAHKNNRIGQLFKASDDGISAEPELELTYYFQTWRGHMVSVVSPAVDTIIQNRFELISDYSSKLTKVYHERLQQLVDQQVKAKNNVASYLSEEEKQLQKDNEWLTCFKEQLNAIERS